ncbi:MAG: protein-methionine-sulfoxide reductase heme-binding subunit MsrQ [Gammaproteobacteria bacterium]|nr:protein-methionine-sulfoxide reductase heme-binding subunit MsrQ [Gammaproteobacteria bacterium]MDP2141888.1 protein-methionine-sulfoxide reductase heme-binding subunit MsrQ [Gammaproteobacteria bacterium]MDP2347230.1 protein-methionine-sulfoxide reductase heme-binding subunit MsrQ [Gammaproteobacteria bacterium]
MLTAIRWLVFSISLLPFISLLCAAIQDTLGPDPADTLAIETGVWTLRFLLLSLAITPLRELSGWVRLVPYRRTFGLFALFYASVHFLTYIVFLLQFRWLEIFDDILDRPYITVGFLSFLILVVLGCTSSKVMMRKLGRRWKKIHTLVYLANILGLIHLIWILRTDLTEAVIYGSILLPLLIYRAYKYFVARRAKAGLLSRVDMA